MWRSALAGGASRASTGGMRGVASSTRLAVVLLIAIGSSSCASGDSDTASETTGSGLSATSTDSAVTDAPAADVGPPVDAELLTIGDMPEAYSWSVAEVPTGFWDDGFDAFSVHICDPIGMSVFSMAPPTDADHRAGRILEGHGVVHEAVLSGERTQLEDAFAAVTQRLAECLNSPVDPNLDELEYELVATELPLLGVGEAAFVMRQQLTYQSRPFCEHRLAIVLTGSRLVLVEHSTGGAADSLSDAEFVQLTEKAGRRVNT